MQIYLREKGELWCLESYNELQWCLTTSLCTHTKPSPITDTHPSKSAANLGKFKAFWQHPIFCPTSSSPCSGNVTNHTPGSQQGLSDQDVSTKNSKHSTQEMLSTSPFPCFSIAGLWSCSFWHQGYFYWFYCYVKGSCWSPAGLGTTRDLP